MTRPLDVPAPLLDHPDAAELLDRPRCLGCEHRPATVGYLCAGCERAWPALLDTIRGGWARLDATPHGAGAGHDGAGPGRSPYGPRDGARVDVLALTASPAGDLRLLPPPDLDTALDVSRATPVPDNPGSRAYDHFAECFPTSHASARPREGDRRSRTELQPTVVALGLVADQCREGGLIGPLAGPRTVAGEALRLSSPSVVEAVSSAWWAGWAFAVLRRQAGAIAAALDEVEPRVPLGPCPHITLGPARLDRVDDQVRVVRPRERCPGSVRSRDGGASARCTADSGHRWHGVDEVHGLAARLGDAHLDGPALRAYLEGLGHGEVSAVALRKWAQLDGWGRRRVGRGTLYRLADALVSAAARRPVRSAVAS